MVFASSVSAVSTVPVAVVIATLVAAVLHAGWNAIAHWIPDKTAAMTLVPLGCALCSLPLIWLAAPPDSASWPYLAASSVLHVLYNVLLMQAYRFGDFSQTYPLARGTAPLVVALVAATILGETPRPAQLAGVLLISMGLAFLVFWGHRTNPVRPAAIAAAIATGLVIASYTVVDGIGIRQSHSTLGYIGWLMLLGEITVPILVFAWRGPSLLPLLRPVWHIGLLGGALSIAAYGLVLWSQTRGALASIAAMRESSIILVAIIGAVWFKEGFGRARILATCAVTAGIAIMCLA